MEFSDKILVEVNINKFNWVYVFLLEVVALMREICLFLLLFLFIFVVIF